jgi:hypothetical protein
MLEDISRIDNALDTIGGIRVISGAIVVISCTG